MRAGVDVVIGILPGQSPTLPGPWLPIRLAESLDSAWQQNVAPVRVSASSQDADGWITLALQNPSPAADFPSKAAYRRFALRLPDGSPLTQVATGSLVQVLIQRDVTGWPGSTAQATIGLGLIDRDGDITHASAVGLLAGIRTPSAASTCTLIAGSPTAASAVTSVASSRAAGLLLTTEAQTLLAAVAGYSGSTIVSAAQYGITPGTVTGNRRLVLTAGCNSTAANGPHAVCFRAWYQIMSARSLPWVS
jgi:hypothetical protein